MLDIAQIDIRIGSSNPRYLNVDLDGEEIGYLLLSEHRLVGHDSHERRNLWIIEELRRVASPIVIAAGMS